MDIKSFGERVINNLEKVIVGKRDALELIVVGLLCQGTYSDRRCARRRQDDDGTQSWRVRWLAPSAASSSRPICFPAM